MRIRIQPYRAGSRSARALSEVTGIRRVRLVRTRFRPRAEDRILNWGSGELMFPERVYINKPYAVACASDKAQAYAVMQAAGVAVPPFTADSNEAHEWWADGKIVLCRQLLRASEGRGIIVVHPEEPYRDQLPDAPLYTQYVPKYDEYRVHVFNGQVIDIQQKRRRNGEEADSRIRNARNGWVFCRQEVNPPEVVMEQALRSIHSLGLDFGAVDIGFTRRDGRATVYEANTAPGLEGTTLERYGVAIRRAAQSMGNL